MFGNFSEKLKTKTGRIIFSILLGVGLASLFRKTCKNRDCLEFRGPSLKEVTKNTYKHSNNCYKFDYETTKCKNKAIPAMTEAMRK